MNIDIVRKKKIYQAFELTKETIHPLVKHYGPSGPITQNTQMPAANRAFISGGAGYCPYGQIIVIETIGEKTFTMAYSKSRFENDFEIVSTRFTS